MEDVERRFDYNPQGKWVTTLGGLMVLLAPLMVGVASRQDMPVDLEIGITLNPHQALFYWLGLSLIMLVAGGKIVVDSVRQARIHRSVVFTSHALILSETPSEVEDQVIEYKDITHLEISKYKGVRFLAFTHPLGSVNLNAACMRSRKAFEEMAALLTEKVRDSAVAMASPAPAPTLVPPAQKEAQIIQQR